MPRYTFGPFLLDTEARALLRGGEQVAMAGKTFDTLAVLVQNHGRLMDKDELLSEIWPGLVVEEANLSQSIFTVRKSLGDSPKDRRYIATVAGRGYQFVAPVTELSTEPLPEPTPEPAATAPAPRLHKRVALSLIALAVAGGAVLWLVLQRPAKTTAELVERRLTFNSSASPITSAAISPDGKYLAYSDPSGIHIRLLSTGEQQLVPTPALIPSDAQPHVDSWFPNGSELLIHSYDSVGPRSLWAVSVAGQSSRELRRDAWGWSVSPDGSSVAFSPLTMYDSPSEIWIMDNQGRNAHKILSSARGEGLWCVRWSPDGQRLAYVRARDSQQLIETCDLKGANRTTVVGGEPRSFYWLPDRRIVYSQGEARNVDANLWSIGVDNHTGEPIGKPKRLTRWTGADLQGISSSADGKRLVLRKDTFPGQIYIGELTAGGTRLSTPRLLSHDEAFSAGTGWTADSQAVLLMSNRNGKWGIFRQPIGTDAAAPLVEGRDDAKFPHLSPDGKWVIYLERAAVGQPTPYRLMRVAVSGGPPQLVLEGTNLQHHQCLNGPNLCVVIEWKQDEKQFIITAFDPLKGRGKLLRTIEHVDGAVNYALAPDGSTFAIAINGQPQAHIRFFSLTSGADREVAIKGWLNTTSMEWAPDGRALYCGTASSQSATLLRVDLKGTAQILWQSREVGGESFLGASPSPDGRHLAINGGTRNSNAWMIEGY